MTPFDLNKEIRDLTVRLLADHGPKKLQELWNMIAILHSYSYLSYKSQVESMVRWKQLKYDYSTTILSLPGASR